MGLVEGIIVVIDSFIAIIRITVTSTDSINTLFHLAATPAD